MGTQDEHWCNVCKRSLNKKTDLYVEFELVNVAKKSIKSIMKLKKPKGIICVDCIEKDPKLKEAIERMTKAGNPNFVVSLMCTSDHECENFEIATDSKGVNCAHIVVLGDQIYCKRSHPGAIHLPQEEAEVERFNRECAMDWMRNLLKNPRLKALIDPSQFEKLLDTAYVSPSSIIKEQHDNLPKQT